MEVEHFRAVVFVRFDRCGSSWYIEAAKRIEYSSVLEFIPKVFLTTDQQSVGHKEMHHHA
jgi:hypothetical protein